MTQQDPGQADELLLESLQVIEQLEAALKAERSRQRPTVAIIGMACQFPGAIDLHAFWHLLHEQVDAISSIPKDRFDAASMSAEQLQVREGGFVGNLREFDAEFFGVSPREARSLDPQQRLLLEVTWQTLEHAGTVPASLRESRTGVFMGLCSNDYQQILAQQPLAEIDAYLSSGTCHSTAAGRISYWLGLKGPSLAIDTACSSSLVALHQARLAIENGDCDQALVGGVNRIILPQVHVNFQQAGMLAPDGRCKAFSASADGFTRAEGCGVVFLKRLDAAERDGDRILAVLAGSACNQDGRSAGLTVPNGPAQADLIRRALTDAGLTSADIDYIEAHGTGTRLGDPIEVNSLSDVFASRPLQDPLPIGSVKTNIGHLEAAAGIASLIKVVLSLQHDCLPAQRYAESLSRDIDWDSARVRPLAVAKPWPRTQRRRIAGVSSFGFSGTNAHVLIAEAPVAKVAQTTSGVDDLLLPLSARHPSALAGLRDAHIHALAGELSSTGARAHCQATAQRRDAMPWRLCARGADAHGLGQWLQRAALPSTRSRSAVRVAFMFTGQGGLHERMAGAWAAADSQFAAHLEALSKLASPYCDRDLHDLLRFDEADCLADTRYAQPALLVLQLATLRRLRELAIAPSVVLGHSVGEIGALVAAGVLSEVDAVRFACKRGALMSEGMAAGGMTAVFCTASDVGEWLNVAPGLTVAALNAEDIQVVAGPKASMDALNAALQAGQQAHSVLRVAHAFHTEAVDAVLARLADLTAVLELRPASTAFVGSLHGRRYQQVDASYLIAQCRQPVQFASALRQLDELAVDVCVEIGPGKSLLGLARRALPDCVLLPTMPSAGRADDRLLPEAVGVLWEMGVNIRWDAWYGSVAPVRDLPTYPFQRQPYWVDAANPGPMASDLPSFDKALRDAGIDALDSGAESLLRRFYAALRGEAMFAPGLLHHLQWQSSVTVGLRPPVSVSPAAPPTQTATLQQYRVYEEALEQLAVAYVRHWWRSLGLEQRPQTMASINLAASVTPKLQPLVPRLLAMLQASGDITLAGDAYTSTERMQQAAPLPALVAMFQAAYGNRVEFRLLHRCASELPAVLRGQVNPVHLLFPDNNFDDATELYRDGPVLNALSQSLCDWLTGMLDARHPGQGLSILEIGGGTGGTTAHVLPRLAGQMCRYVFTDVGPAFVARAKREFANVPGFSAAVFDLENSDSILPADTPHDLVIAANVVHATRDIERSIRRAKSQLKPGGWIALVEGTARQGWVDLTFGLTDGWWCFEQDPRRSDYPLLSADAWTDLLNAVGFESVQVVDGHPGSSQKLFLAQLPAVPEDDGTRHLVVGQQSVAREQVAAALAANAAASNSLVHCDSASLLHSLHPHSERRLHVHLVVSESDSDLSACCQTVLVCLREVQHRPEARVTLWVDSALGRVSATAQGLLAFCRVASLERGQLGVSRVLVDTRDTITLTLAVQEVLTAAPARELKWLPTGRSVMRMLPWTARQRAFNFKADGQYLLTGGLGG